MPTFVSGDDYVRLPRDPEPWVIQHLVATGGMTNLYGPPKTAKSFAALGMAIAVSSGALKWLKFDVLKHGPVAYLQIDTPRSEWSRRLNQLKWFHYDVSKIFFADMYMTPFPYNILDPSHLKWLTEEMKVIKPVMVVVDTLREVHSGDENDSTPMKMVIAALVSACKPAAIVLISHSRKESPAAAMAGLDSLMSDARGSSYVAGRMDTVVKFTETSMTYKGRGLGEGRLSIVQNDDTALVELNTASEAYAKHLEDRVRELRGLDPEVTINKMAGIIETELKELATTKDIKSLGKSTINKDIKQLLLKWKLEERERLYSTAQLDEKEAA